MILLLHPHRRARTGREPKWSFKLLHRESGTLIQRSGTGFLIPALPRQLVRMPERLGNPVGYGRFQCHVNRLRKIHLVPGRNKNRFCACYGSDCHTYNFSVVQYRPSRPPVCTGQSETPGQQALCYADRRYIKDQTDMAGKTKPFRMSVSMSVDKDEIGNGGKAAKGIEDCRAFPKG